MAAIAKIAVLTSGGDAPGINACIRAVVMTALSHRLQVVGVHGGYDGLIDGNFLAMNEETVFNIVQTGGTILDSSRSKRFTTPEGREAAWQQLQKAAIDAVILIGGDGSLEGAKAFTAVHPISWIGIPKTIDNDILGTDRTIGFDTATNTAMAAIDKIRDTAESHNRLCFVEVMGRNAGFIAWHTAIATGAEAVFLPERTLDLPQLFGRLEERRGRENQSFIVVVAEGEPDGGAYAIAEKTRERFPQYDAAVSVLGYIQRGGAPSCADRILASRLGVSAVNSLVMGYRNVMVGEICGSIVLTPLEKITNRHLDVSFTTVELMNALFARFDEQLNQ